jgi:hypothetical protein
VFDVDVDVDGDGACIPADAVISADTAAVC